MFLGTVVIVFFATFNLFAQDEATAPVFKDGDYWQFKAVESGSVGSSSNALNGIYELFYSGGKFGVFYVEGNTKQELDDARYGWLLHLLGKSRSLPDLKFPLSVGKKWDYQHRSRSYGSARDSLRSVQISVTGIERVTTPSGTFRAFKLQKDDRAAGNDFWITTYYYSPETGSIVKSSADFSSGTGAGTQREIELIKFGSVGSSTK